MGSDSSEIYILYEKELFLMMSNDVGKLVKLMENRSQAARRTGRATQFEIVKYHRLQSITKREITN